MNERFEPDVMYTPMELSSRQDMQVCKDRTLRDAMIFINKQCKTLVAVLLITPPDTKRTHGEVAYITFLVR